MAQQLEGIFRESLGLEPDVDVTGLEYGKHERWDSVAHMALVGDIEDAYGIMLETDDVVDMSSYQKAVEILGRHGVAA